MFKYSTPRLLQWLSSPWLLWKKKSGHKSIYLTFDDGPTPGITENILEILSSYNAKATFFCTGKNVEKHPILYQQIISDGHVTGNHTYSHPDGWKTSRNQYIEDVNHCEELVKSSLFRPPYGHISFRQARAIGKKYRIVMWDVLSNDFNQVIPPILCAQKVINLALDGSIVVFHDTEKAKENCLGALPLVLDHFSRIGFSFKSLPDTINQ
jgi:peptidoglycan-N-acetylglucosamine deacetylase